MESIQVSTSAIGAAIAPAFIQRGCVIVIGLDVIRARAGTRWDKMHDTICSRLEAILHQRLGPADFFLALNETAYCVVMPGGEAVDAEVCCLRVAHELHTNLLGPCSTDHVRLSRARSIDRGVLTLEPIVPPGIVDLAMRAGLQEILPDAIAARSSGEKIARPGSASPSVPAFTFSFAPWWDARHEAITTWRCLARKNGPGRDAGFAGGIAKLKDDLSRALSALYHSAAVLAERIERGERFLIDVPVPYEVLCAPVGRMEFAAACRSLPADYRPYLIFEISDMPAGVPASRINEFVTGLKPFCRAVFAQAPLRLLNHSGYQNAGLGAIGIALLPGTTPGIAREEIDRLAAHAKKLSLMSFALEVDRIDLLAQACNAGIGFVSGPVIGAVAASPQQVSRLTRAQLEDRARRAAAS